MTDRDLITKWLINLGNLCVPQAGATAVGERVRAYVPLLADQFGRSAFCHASLEAVARQCEFFPAYGRLATLLSAWWREHRPPLPALRFDPPPPPPREPPTPEERAAVAAALASLRAEMAARYPSHRPAPSPGRAVSPRDLAAAYRQQIAAGDPRFRELAEMRLAALEGDLRAE